MRKTGINRKPASESLLQVVYWRSCELGGKRIVSAKLRIKTKGIEIEWEGDVEFLKAEVPDLIASIIQAIGAGEGFEDEETGTESDEGAASAGTFTTASAAARVQAKTGPELFKVALTKLQSDGIEPAKRMQILTEMKSASKFYKPSMLNNLNRTIDTLLSTGEVNEPSKGVYALSHTAQDALLRRISQ
jgi:hypothetical protein